MPIDASKVQWDDAPAQIDPRMVVWEDVQDKSAPPVSRTDRVLQGMRDPIAGGAQLLTRVLPEGVVQAGNDFNNWLADKTGMVARLPAGGVDQFERQREAQYQASRGSDAGTFDGYRVAGNVASPANLAIAGRAPAAATMLGRVGLGAGAGAASAALNPVTNGEAGDYWAEKSKQIGTGAAFGGAMPLITSAVGRIVSPQASTNPQVQLLRQEGVRPTIGQTLGGWANAAEEKLQSVPIVGDMISSARNTAREDFNRSALNRALAPIGAKADDIGFGGVSGAQKAVSNAYDSAKGALGTVRLDQQAGAEMQNLNSLVQSLPQKEQGAFRSVVESIRTDIGKGGQMLGDSYKRVDSKLGKEAARFGGSSDAYQQQLGDAVGELNRIIRENAMRSNPQAASAMRNADKAYANLVRVEGAAKMANADGVFTPGQLASAVRQADKSVRDRATAGGNALMQDLSAAGQSVLGNKIPNSGTVDRLLLGTAGLGSYVLNPAIPASLLGGAALYTQPAQSLLRSAVASRPQQAQAVRDALLKASPRLLPAAAQVGVGLLGYPAP